MVGFSHDHVIKNTVPKLSFSDSRDYSKWKEEIREKFIELFGIDKIEKNLAENPDFQIESEVDMGDYTRIRFSFYSEVDARVPVYILIPKDIKKGEKRPVVITLQGHSTGFHNSVGIPLYHGDEFHMDDEEYQKRNGKFAVQAVNEGYIAVAIEQRGMGERSATNQPDRRVHVFNKGCYYESVTAILLGRTIQGERIIDISRTIDMLDNFKDVCDLDKIILTGNSGGGTATYYTACYDERIKIAAPSCAFCPYPESILNFYHCSCNYIPRAFEFFDMQDLACLIAPRQLVLVNGKLDPSFLIEGVRRGYETVKKIYEKAGAKDSCRSVETEKGHYWCDDLMWPLIKEELQKLK